MTSRTIAIVAPPLPGHWDPLRVLARELAARGHRPIFVHMSDAAAMLDGESAGHHAVGASTHGAGALEDYRRLLARAPRLSGFLPMLRATAAMSAMLLEELPAAFQQIGADAIIADESEPAGALAAIRAGLPWITSVTALPLLRDPAIPPPFVRWPYRDDEQGLRRNRGGHMVTDLLIRPISRVLDHYGRDWGIDPGRIARGSPLLQVAQCPPGLDFPRTDLPSSFHYCGPFRSHPGDERIAVEKDSRPLIYCSLGSLQGNDPALFSAMSTACADLGARALVAHGGLLSDRDAARLPGDPIVRAFWPQPAVLHECQAAILHGGFNTILDALGAGIPMLVVPLAFEQPGTAARVERTDAGLVLPRRRVSRRRIRDRLRQLLEQPAHKEAAQSMAAEMSKLGGARSAADLIEAALARAAASPATA